MAHIKINCPNCGTNISVPDSLVSRVHTCLICGNAFSVSNHTPSKNQQPLLAKVLPLQPPILAARVQATEADLDDVENRHSCCRAITGLQIASEQRISGSSFISGSQGMNGSFSNGTGSIHGHGSLFGAGRLDTNYAYETRFFVRTPTLDIPMVFSGERLHLLEDHRITLLYVDNRDGERLNYGFINRNTRSPIHWMASEQKIVDHLDIDELLPMERLVLSADKRRRIIASYKAKINLFARFGIYVLIGAIAFLAVAIPLFFSKWALVNTIGAVFLIIAITCPIVYLSMLGWYRSKVAEMRLAQSHAKYYVKNIEVDEELEAIYGFATKQLRTG